MKKTKLFMTLATAALVGFFTACEQNQNTPEGPGTNNGNDSTAVAEATGDGSLENPFNSIAANDLGKSLTSGETTEDFYYIKGIVSSIKEAFAASPAGYGNGTFYISDDGSASNTFYVYRAYYLNNEKWTENDPQVNVGDEVIVYAKITNYNGTIETAQGSGYIYSHNGNTSNTPDPGNEGEATGDGTLENPYNSVAANQFASSLAADTPSEEVYIKGKIVSITENYGTQFGNATFYISDDGTAAGQFLVYRALYLNNEKYTEGALLEKGDDVVVYGKLVNYKGNTPETVQGEAYLYSLVSNGLGEEVPELGGEVFDFSAQGYENAEELDGVEIEAGNATIVFSTGTGSTTPKYYTTGAAARMYGGNTMTISSDKTITKIEFQYGEDYNGTTYTPVADNLSVDTGTYDFTAHAWNGSSSTVVISKASGTGHFRIQKVGITYAE